MSNANESEWSNKTGRKSAKPGLTRNASVQSGLSEYSQQSGSTGINGHGQGQRPSKLMTEKMSHGGKSFTSR